MNKLRVICVKWGDAYNWEWVTKLKKMVERNLTIPHDFVCMTDSFDDAPDGQLLERCEPNLPTWWAKLGLFAPDKFPGLNLYLDLDVIITGNIDDMVRENAGHHYLHAPDDFSYSLVNPKQGIGAQTRRLLGGPGTVNSSVMIWRGNAARDAFSKFRPEKMKELHGDQNWITQCLWPDKLRLLTPGWVCSYKYHVQQGTDEQNAPIVVFHGNPKPDQLGKANPLRKIWEA